MSKWMQIPGFNGYYQASDKGEIRSVDRIVEKRDGRLEHRKGMLLKQATDKDGYKTVQLNCCGQALSKKVHRLVAMAHLLNKDLLKTFINHKDGDKANNCVSNLEWVTASENSLHAVNTGLSRVGENHVKAKRVKCVKTGKEFGTVKDAASYMRVPYSTLRSDLHRGNGNYIINLNDWPDGTA